MQMSSHALSGIRLRKDLIDDLNGLHELDMSAAARTDFFMDCKQMMLELKRARLDVQLACSRTQSLVAEMELRIAETELKYELTHKKLLESASAATKTPCNVIKPLHEALETLKGTQIVQKNTKDSGTQVDMNVEKLIETTKSPKGTGDRKVDEKKGRRRSKKKRSSEKESQSEKRIENSRVGADNAPRMDFARAATATGCKETENTNPRKKRKTDVENIPIADKSENGKHKKDHKERHRNKDDSNTKHNKVSDRNRKTETNTKSTTSNDPMQELNDNHNSKYKDTTEKNVKYASKSNDQISFADKLKKPIKSTLKTPTTNIINDNNIRVNDQEAKKNKNETIKVNLVCNREKPENTDDVNFVLCKEELEDNIGEYVNIVTTDSNVEDTRAADSLDGTRDTNDESEAIKTDKTHASNSDSGSFTVVLEITDNSLVQQIQEMYGEPVHMETMDNEDLGWEQVIIKRDRFSSISSVETLVLQDCKEDIPV